jgi:hypothetical protein
MKKFMMFLAALALSTGLTFAQDAKQKAPQAAPKKEVKKAPETPKDGTTIKEEAPAKHLNKDGTPDMRYKENKEAAKPAGPKKKDGTPDMRYKDNKAAAKPKAAAKK